MGQEKRRHDRFFVQLPVDLSSGRAASHGETVDVSFGGLFVRTASPPPLRQLVKVDMRIPPKNQPLQLMAMAVFVEAASSGNSARGVGLQLFGLDPTTRERWETFVKYVRSMPRVEKVSEQRASLAPTEEEAPVWNDVQPEVRIRVREPSDLERILDREMKKGRMYVRTALYLESNRSVELHFIHPVTERSYVITGQVDERVQRPGFEGLRILLPRLQPTDLGEFRSFVRGDRPPTIDVEPDALGDVDILDVG